ncbi:MAG: mechanosensitive ion channel family protein [Rhizobiaceae bacterium]
MARIPFKPVIAAIFALLGLQLVLAITAQAQLTTPTNSDSEKVATDTLGRTTPRGTVEGFIKAIRESGVERASRYLDVSNYPLGERPEIAVERAEQLIQLLDRNGTIFDITDLSASPDGSLTDGLDDNREQVGILDRTRDNAPLMLHQVKGPDNLTIWLFEPEMLDRVPFLLQISSESLVDRLLPQQLKEIKLGKVAIGHWMAIGLLAIIAICVGLAISWAIIFIWSRVPKAGSRLVSIARLDALASIRIPLGVLIGVAIYRMVVSQVGIQLIARDTISWISTIAALLAVAWLGIRIVDGVADVARYGMSRSKQLNSVAVVMLARRIAKAIVLGLVTLTILDILGFDVTTGLAALGIGGLALALGAQKTIENLVGSITVVVDKPVSVGDFCQFEGVMGTVEDIGIRSTRVRTLDRTLVSVPNGAFASMQIENFAKRDEFRLRTILTMRYETTPAQIRFLLKELRQLLADSEAVTENPARVRFIGLGSHSLDIEIFAYVRARDYNEFLAVQEELLLDIMDIVKQSGSDFAFPSQTLYFGKDHPPSPKDAERIGRLIEKMQFETPLIRPDVESKPSKPTKRRSK